MLQQQDRIVVCANTGRYRLPSWLISEIIYGVLVIAAATSAYYDFSVPNDKHISIYVNRWTHQNPILAFLAGALVIFMAYGIHKAWKISFRYVIAILILGVVLGHLFWAQSTP